MATEYVFPSGGEPLVAGKGPTVRGLKKFVSKAAGFFGSPSPAPSSAGGSSFLDWAFKGVAAIGAIAPIARFAYESAERKRQDRAVFRDKVADQGHERLLRGLRKVRDFEPDGELCDDDVCMEVQWGTDRRGRLIARQADGGFLKNCKRGADDKRSCTVKGRELTEH